MSQQETHSRAQLETFPNNNKNIEYIDQLDTIEHETSENDKLINEPETHKNHFEFKKRNSLYFRQSSLPHSASFLNTNRIIDKRVTINVGGVRFETYKETLKLISESRLANLSPTNSDYDSIRKEYFFDRDPNSFLAIINYYRTGKLHAPLDVCGNLFHEELTFWGIGERSIQPCCWTTFSHKRDCDEILKKVMEEADGKRYIYSKIRFT